MRSQPCRIDPGKETGYVTPPSAGGTYNRGPQHPRATVHLYSEDPDDVHPVRRLDVVPFHEGLHCVNHYARQPVPRVGVVSRQEERTQGVLVPEDGCGGMSYLHIIHHSLGLSHPIPPPSAAAFTVVAANPALRALLNGEGVGATHIREEHCRL